MPPSQGEELSFEHVKSESKGSVFNNGATSYGLSACDAGVRWGGSPQDASGRPDLTRSDYQERTWRGAQGPRVTDRAPLSAWKGDTRAPWRDGALALLLSSFRLSSRLGPKTKDAEAEKVRETPGTG